MCVGRGSGDERPGKKVQLQVKLESIPDPTGSLTYGKVFCSLKAGVWGLQQE